MCLYSTLCLILDITPVRTTLCDDEAAIIQCSDATINVLSGKIIRPPQEAVSFTFSHRVPSIGMLLGTHTIMYQMVITNTSISVSFTFYEPVNYNGTILLCGNQFLPLDFSYREGEYYIIIH